VVEVFALPPTVAAVRDLDPMHTLLQSQLGRLNLDPDQAPSVEQWRSLLATVDRAYAEADTDRDTLEQSLGNYTAEIKQLYVDLRQASASELATERDKLRDLTRFLDSIVENIPDIVFVKDAQTLHFVRVNRAAEEVFGISRSAMVGGCDADFFPTHEAEYFASQDRAAIAGRRLVVIEEEQVSTRSNGVRSVSTKKIPILDENGNPIYLLGISRDTTVQKESEKRLRQAEELERETRAQSAFLATMTHELRTPLTSIIGFSEMLEDGLPGALNEKQARYVVNILTSARHLLHLVGEVLDLAKLSAGRMELHRTEADLGGAIRRVCAAIQPLGDKKHIVIHADTGDDDLAAFVDEQRVDQILHNLLSNAVKFTPAGGRVDAIARRKEGCIEVVVRDNGVGIDAADRDRIFRDFVQGDSSYTRAQQGTGLGLALTKRLVELHGGRIRVDSALGTGSAFTFSLPIRPAADPAGP
jgi:PAS domain S-box-containing protein